MSFMFLLFFNQQVNAEVVSMSVGQVGDHVITSREALQSLYAEKVLFTSATQIPKDLSSKVFANRVSAIILEWVVYLEAKSFNFEQNYKKDFNKKLRKIKRVLAKNPNWVKLETTPLELRDVLRVKLIAKEFIQFKASSAVVPVTDTEAENYYNENKTKFGKTKFLVLKQNIKSFLNRKQVDSRLKSWFEVLRSKHRVRNFLL